MDKNTRIKSRTIRIMADGRRIETIHTVNDMESLDKAYAPQPKHKNQIRAPKNKYIPARTELCYDPESEAL